MRRHPLQFAFRILATISAFAWFFSTVPFQSLFDKLTHVNWRIVALAYLSYSTWIIPSALRWRGIAQSCGYNLPFWTSVRLYTIGSFFNTFLPTGNGGDVVRGIMLSQEQGHPLGGIWGTIFVERIIGLVVSLCLILIIGSVLFTKVFMLKNVIVSTAILSTCILALCFLLFSRKIRGFIKPILKKVAGYYIHEGARDVAHVLDTCWGSPRVMFYAVLFSFANQFTQIVSGFVLSLAILDFKAPFVVFLVVIPLSFVSVLLPSIGGYGVREVGYILFFGWFGIRAELSAVFGVLRLMTIWPFSLGGAVLYVFGKHEKKKGKGLATYNWIK